MTRIDPLQAKRLFRKRRKKYNKIVRQREKLQNEITLSENMERVYEACIRLADDAPITHIPITGSQITNMLASMRDNPQRTAQDKTVFPVNYKNNKDFFDRAQIFVCNRDFGDLIANKDELKGAEWRLPFPECSFEFRFKHGISTFHIVCVAKEQDGIKSFRFVTRLSEMGFEMWFDGVEHDENATAISLDEDVFTLPFAPVVINDIRAACILMDCEAIEKEQTRVDHRLNEAREKRGKPPLYSFHTLKFKRPVRYIGEEFDSDENRRSVRLHVRRGHWRHFPKFKTWVRWCIVGDADAGVADKSYQL